MSKSGLPVHGGDVYRNRVMHDFSVNLNPAPLPQALIGAAEAGLAEMGRYPDPQQQGLKEAIASFERTGCANIICGNGASELLMAVCHAFRPKRALITAPCYAGYERALRAVDADVREYRLDAENGFALDDGFTDELTEDTDMVFICDPNNPDGRLIDAELKQKIADICDAKGIVLVIDECFMPLTRRGLERSPVSDRALHLRAFTKTFAVPGIRTGYMISNDEEKLSLIARHLPEWNVSAIAARTGEAAARILEDTDFLGSSVRMIEEERSFLSDELTSMGIRAYESDTNFILIQSRDDLYDKLLERGILIRNCSNFSGLGSGWFRIAVKNHSENAVLTAAIKEILCKNT